MKEKIDNLGAYLMFVGALLVATGYGATFILNRHFKSFGGNEIDTGTILVAAMVGTFVSVPVVGWFSRRVGEARLAALGAVFLALGFGMTAASIGVSTKATLGGFAIGVGWGAFYLAAPMALSQRTTNEDRSYWFMRFAAFQMAGIGVSPFLAELALDYLGITSTTFFYAVSLACLIASALLLSFERRAPLETARGIVPWISALPRIAASPSRFPIVMVALGACVFSGVMTYQTSLIDGMGLFASTFFIVYAVTVVAARWTLAGLINRYPTASTVPLLLTAMLLGTALLYALELGTVPHVLSATLLGLGYGLAYPLIQAQAVNNVARETDQGAALTWFVLSYFIGIFGFPLLGGWIIVALGQTALISTVVLLGGFECVLAVWRNRAVMDTEISSKA